MSFWTKARDAVENTAAIATDPFTAGQSGRLTSKSAQGSKYGKFANIYGKGYLAADVIGGAVGGALLLPGVAGGTAAADAGASTAASAPFYSGADAEAFGAGINPETGAAMDLGAEPLGDAGGAGVDTAGAVSDTAAVPLAGPGATGSTAASGGTSAATAGGASNAIAKFGPLALGGLGLASNYIAGRNAQKQIAHIGDAQRAEGQQLLDQFNSGKLTIADQHAIDTYQASATAAAKQYFANSGQSNSTAALSTINTINANVAAMQSQALQNYLKLGTGLLNITDQYQLSAIEQGIANDKSMWQMLFQFGSTYGQWNRSLATMTA